MFNKHEIALIQWILKIMFKNDWFEKLVRYSVGYLLILSCIGASVWVFDYINTIFN